MSSSIARSPWQVVLASAALVVLGVAYATSALVAIAQTGDRLGITEALAEHQAIPGFDNASSPQALLEWFTLSATVFGVLAAVFIVMGVLLWQGAARPGVRLTAAITTLIALVGSIMPLMAGTEGDNAVAHESLAVQAGIHALAFIAILLLWAPSARSWFAERD